MASSAARTRTRGSSASTSPPRRDAEGVVAAFAGADLADEWAGALPCAWLVDRGHEAARRTGRSRSTRLATSATASRSSLAESRGAREDAAELVEVDYEPLPVVDDVEAALARRRAARPRGVRHEPLLHVDARSGRGRAALRRGRRHGEGALPPEPADPERDRAARRARAADPGDRASSRCGRRRRSRTSQRVTLSGRHRHPRGEAARDRARRRRRLRLEAERLRRGGALPRARAEARACRQVDGGRARGLPRDDPRPRRRPGDRARGDRRGEDHRRARAADGGDGRVPPARDARDPDCSAPGSTAAATTSRATTSSAPASSRTRRRPTRTAAPAGRRRRTRSSVRSTRSRASSARTRSSCGG